MTQPVKLESPNYRDWETNADNERKKSLNEMIRLERALAASDKAKISEYMAGLQATEKGLQNQIKGLQLANAALKQNANEIQNINNKTLLPNPYFVELVMGYPKGWTDWQV